MVVVDPAQKLWKSEAPLLLDLIIITSESPTLRYLGAIFRRNRIFPSEFKILTNVSLQSPKIGRACTDPSRKLHLRVPRRKRLLHNEHSFTLDFKLRWAASPRYLSQDFRCKDVFNLDDSVMGSPSSYFCHIILIISRAPAVSESLNPHILTREPRIICHRSSMDSLDGVELSDLSDITGSP